MNKYLLSLVVSVSLFRFIAAEDVAIPEIQEVKYSLEDLVTHKEERKTEIDKICELVETTVKIQMAEVNKLISDFKYLWLTIKQQASDKKVAINKIMKSLSGLDFRIKELYPDQLKDIETIENLSKEQNGDELHSTT